VRLSVCGQDDSTFAVDEIARYECKVSIRSLMPVQREGLRSVLRVEPLDHLAFDADEVGTGVGRGRGRDLFRQSVLGKRALPRGWP
jgi:hypothetical protein